VRACLWVVIVAALVLGLPELPHASAQASSAPDSGYAGALRAADLFLSAWARRDPDAGLALLSAAVLARDPDSTQANLRQYMSGLSNPHHEAYEISAGSRTAPDRFAFAVRLFQAYLGEPEAYAFSDTLEVVRQGNAWRIDRLPRPER
jgi:hypothetical protein